MWRRCDVSIYWHAPCKIIQYMGQASDAYIDYLHTQCVSTEHDNGRDNNEHKHQSKLSEKINLNSYSSSDFWWDAFGSFDSDTESLFMVQIINCEMFTILLEQICTLLCWLIRPIADLRAPKKTRLGRWRWIEFMMLVVVCRAWQWCWWWHGYRRDYQVFCRECSSIVSFCLTSLIREHRGYLSRYSWNKQRW